MGIKNPSADHIKKYGETNKEVVEKVFGPIEGFRGYLNLATVIVSNTDLFLTVLLSMAVVAYEKGLVDGEAKVSTRTA